MASRHRVIHLITRLDLGGAQQNTLYSVAHHDRSRYEVGLWAGAGGLLDDEAMRLPDADVRLFPWLVHPIAPARDALALVRLTGALRRARPDLIHTHSSKAGILGRLAARRAGVRAIVHTVHGWSFNPTQAAPVRAGFVTLERFAARWTDVIVCVAETDRDEGVRRAIAPAGRFRIVRSGIDPASYRAGPEARSSFRDAFGWAEDRIVVGTLACLKRQKAPLDFVKAAAIARRQEPSLRFFIAGDGELRGEVERAAEAEGIAGDLEVLGWRRDVPAALAAMDIFLLTSRFEGLPRSILQAMAAGVPVVATEVCGTPEVVRHGETGFLVRPGRPEDAAAAVLALARDTQLRQKFAAAARARIGAEFEIDRMVATLDDLYGEVLGVRPEGRTAAVIAGPAGGS